MFDFSCHVVNTDVEITPGQILLHYTCAADSRVCAMNPRKQLFILVFFFSASANTTTIVEVLSYIAVNLPAMLDVISERYSHCS